MKRTYAIVIEWAEENYSAYAPDVPGCIAVGDTVQETMDNMQEALAFHFEGMQQHGETIPESRTHVGTVEVAVEVPAAD